MSSSALVPFQPEPVALVDLNVPQLAEACRALEQCQERYDKLSGICATMRGFVLIEVKTKLGHGKFLPWLAENFNKTRKTAAQDMRVARECGKSRPKVTFEILGRDLASTVKELEQSNINLEHPLVKEIAGWVDGRTRYQLLLDFPGLRGGDTSGSRKKLTPEEEHAKFLEDARTDFEAAFLALDGITDSATWKATSISDAMLSDSIELAREFARQAAAWLKLPKDERKAASQEQTEETK